MKEGVQLNNKLKENLDYSFTPIQEIRAQAVNLRKIDDIQLEIDEKEGLVQRLNDTNKELTQQLKTLSQRLDELMNKMRQKQMNDDKELDKARRNVCEHEPIMEKLSQQIQSKHLKNDRIRQRERDQEGSGPNRPTSQTERQRDSVSARQDLAVKKGTDLSAERCQNDGE